MSFSDMAATRLVTGDAVTGFFCASLPGASGFGGNPRVGDMSSSRGSAGAGCRWTGGRTGVDDQGPLEIGAEVRTVSLGSAAGGAAGVTQETEEERERAGSCASGASGSSVARDDARERDSRVEDILNGRSVLPSLPV